MERLEVVVDPPLATAQFKPVEGSSAQFEVTITPSPMLPVGPFKFEVALDLVSPVGERLTGIRLPVEGTVQPEIRPLPARLFLGSRAVGEAVEAFVVLQAQPGTPIIVDQIEADTPDVDIKPFSLAGSPSGRAFRVVQRVAKSGDQVSVIRFTIHKSNQQPQTVNMDVCYRGELNDAGRLDRKAGGEK